MRNTILIVLFIFQLHQVSAQQNNNIQIDAVLYQINEMPYFPELSGDSLFWVIVIQGLNVVPVLIDKLDDTTKTNITVPNFGGFYTIADISYSILEEIIHKLPILDIIRNNKEYPSDEGLIYCAYFGDTYPHKGKSRKGSRKQEAGCRKL